MGISTSSDIVLTTNIPDLLVRRGKVRDVYDLGDGRLVIVATDRISSNDVVMPNGIPDKGKLLTALSSFWFNRYGGDFSHHFLTTDLDLFPDRLKPYADLLRNRSMLVRKVDVVPIECVARGYITGSGWKEYQKSGTVCGIALPAGLRQCDKLPTPIFTPATKEESGHDINISFSEMVARVGKGMARNLRAKTIELYSAAAGYAERRGVLIADTKFEFGTLPDGTVILIDEVLTPDSSRFWPANEYESGHDQPSFDKQFVRNYLETTGWNKTPPAPELPTAVVLGTHLRYVEAYERLTGVKW